jgi:plastocyanin
VICSAFAIAIFFGVASIAQAARVTITEASFEAPVVVIPPGASVTWRNDDDAAHRITGRFCRAPRTLCGDARSSPMIQPDATFTMRFPRSGEFEYRDAANANMRGSVLVVVRSRRPPRARGNAEHHYRATVTLIVREELEWYDDHWRSTTGPCNNYVGDATRSVRWTARFPNVEYSRFPRFGIEVMSSTRPARLQIFSERMDAKRTITYETPLVTCPDGTTDYAPTYDISCANGLNGKPLRITLAWSPRATGNRWFAHNQRGPAIGWSRRACGSLAACSLPSPLPFEVHCGFEHFPYDAVLADAKPAEVRALRAGRTVRVVRELDFAWTDGCCPHTLSPKEISGPSPGAVFRFRARLVIVLTPRR